MKEQENSSKFQKNLTKAAMTMQRDKTKIYQDLRLDSKLVSNLK